MFHSEENNYMPTIVYADDAIAECRKIVAGLVDAGLWDSKAAGYFQPRPMKDGWSAWSGIRGFRSPKLLKRLSAMDAKERRYFDEDSRAIGGHDYTIDIIASGDTITIKVRDEALQAKYELHCNRG